MITPTFLILSYHFSFSFSYLLFFTLLSYRALILLNYLSFQDQRHTRNYLIHSDSDIGRRPLLLIIQDLHEPMLGSPEPSVLPDRYFIRLQSDLLSSIFVILHNYRIIGPMLQGHPEGIHVVKTNFMSSQQRGLRILGRNHLIPHQLDQHPQSPRLSSNVTI